MDKIQKIVNLTVIVTREGGQRENGDINFTLDDSLILPFEFNGISKMYAIHKIKLSNGEITLMTTDPDDIENELIEISVSQIDKYDLGGLVEALELLYPANRKIEDLRINPAGSEELVEISLDPINTPIAYANKVADLVNSGLDYPSAKRLAKEPMEMEVYFQKGLGLFLVETEAVESTDIFSPYTAERYKSSL